MKFFDRKYRAFSFIDMMMYVSLVALSLHYALPSYRLLMNKMKAQDFIQSIQQIQVEIYQYILLKGELPSSEDLDCGSDLGASQIVWDGEALEAIFMEGENEEGHLRLEPYFENYKIHWNCDYDASVSMKTYLCYALS